MPTGGLPAKFSSETSRGEFIQLRELTETGSQAARQPDGRAQVSIGRPAPPKMLAVSMGGMNNQIGSISQ